MLYDLKFADLITVGNFTDDLKRIEECDWVIEVIVENLAIKQNFMKEIARYRKPGSIISSNTSGVSIHDIVKDMPQEFKSHFLGTHYFNPPRYMKLLELIPHQETEADLLEFLTEFGTHRLGKGLVMAKDTPNFIGNRVGTYAIANAIQLMDKYGYSFGQVDQLTGPVMGRPKSATFRTIDMVGLDIFSHVAGNVVSAVEDQTEIARFQLPAFVGQMMQNRQLGNKTKQGFYKVEKSAGGRKILEWDPVENKYCQKKPEKFAAVGQALKSANKYKTMVEGDAPENQYVWETLKNVLLYSAERVPEIADDYREIDKAMRWGFNWEMGPFEIWDRIGVKESIERMQAEGATIPAWVMDRVEKGDLSFYSGEDSENPYLTLVDQKDGVILENPGATLIDLGDGVACLNFTSKSHAVTEDVMDMIHESVRLVEKDFKGLVIGNQGKNFSVGADLTMIGGMAKAQEWGKIDATVSKFQAANMALKYCRKPVVAAPYGMTLGGGAEIALHAHAVVASVETYMGLVEAGVGLLPGGGGTKEMALRSVENLGRATFGTALPYLRKAWEAIAMAKVSGSAYAAVRNGMIRESDRIVMNPDYLVEYAKEQVLHMSKSFMPLVKGNVRVLGTSGYAALQYITDMMEKGEFISPYDRLVADRTAYVMTGGDVPSGTEVSEDHLLRLERQAFVSLCKEDKTLARIEHMLKTGKPLRN
jgi:3-hydroxyacyl-CoA dehydrogenase